MLTPEYLDSLPDPVLELFRQVEEDILTDMARRISKMGAVTETADWQRWRLGQIQLTRSDITERLSKLTGLTQQELRKLFQEAATQAVQADDEIYQAVGLSPGSPNDSPELLQLLNGGMQQTYGTFQNLTRTTANTATQQFERALDRAWLQVSSGAFDYQTVIRRAVKDLAASGLQAITYPSGHTDTLEVAVRRAVLTGVGKTTGEICLAHAEEMGCDLMEITAHPGARPSHMVWQGKLVSLSGRKGYLSKSDIGYGTGDGFKGWNCRHDWFPYFEGLSESAYPREKLREYESQTVSYNGENLSYYDATQQQRYIERQIRRWKREYRMMDAAGQDTTQASLKLAQWRAKERDFCKQTGLDRDGFRSQVEGFGRSQASKAYWQNRKEVEKYSKIHYNKDGTIVVTDDWKSKGKVSIPRKYKPNAVVETQTVYKNGTVQIDRTIYDEYAVMKTQIHSGPHNRPDQHRLGKHGEHSHHCVWDADGRCIDRRPYELTDQERIQHSDILGADEND